MPDVQFDRLINLFGAMALGVSDRIRSTALQAIPSGGETAAALVVIGHEPCLTIDRLSHVLRLSHAGTVRLVDRLVALGLVERRPSETDRRAASLVLTSAGQMQRAELLSSRQATLAPLVVALTDEERLMLERVSEKILETLPSDALTALSICRFCDEQRCAACPMDKFGRVSSALMR